MDTQSKVTGIVIVGGGYAGTEAAKKLAKRYRRRGDIAITLIDRNPYHTLMTELHEIAGSRTESESVQISFKRIFSGTKVKVVTDEITAIDFEAKTMRSDTTEYNYDYLVLGTGGRPDFFGIEGVQQHSFTLWSLEDAIRIREHVERQFRDAAKEPDAERRRRQLTFVVAGAGFTGIELVGELMERADVLSRKYHIDRSEVRLIVVEAQDTVLPILDRKPRVEAHKYLKKRNVEVMLQASVAKAEEGRYLMQDGTVLEANTFVWTCGVQGSEFTAKIDLTKGKVANDECSKVSHEGIHGMEGCHFDEEEQTIGGERGRILVNGQMESPDYPDVYLCGDMIWYVHEGKVVPQIVENALQSGDLVAHNIAAALEKRQKKKFNPKFHGFMVSIGSRYAVASVMNMNLCGFFALALKHMINIHYLWGLAGVNACWGYIWEEFIGIRHKRSLSRGHLSAKIPTFLAVPARLWLGLSWLMEGVNKIGEGWFLFDKSRSGWMFSPGVEQAGNVAAKAAEGVQLLGGNAAVDATASASTAAEAGANAVSQAAGAILHLTVGGVATEPARVLGKVWDFDVPIIPYDSAFVTWFREVFMDGMAAKIHFAWFQVMVVSTEMAIGLALLGGLLTFPAAAVSIVMCAVFTFSGMFSWSQLWYVFLAIFLLGGAGRSFGLDHYLMPWLGDLWSSSKLARRSHLYCGEPYLEGKRKSRPGK